MRRVHHAKTSFSKERKGKKQSDDASYIFLGNITQVNDEASDRVLEVEREFNTKRRPIFEKRNSIIAGVEGFWRTAFLNHPALSTLFTADDVELLSYVTQVSDVIVLVVVCRDTVRACKMKLSSSLFCTSIKRTRRREKRPTTRLSS